MTFNGVSPYEKPYLELLTGYSRSRSQIRTTISGAPGVRVTFPRFFSGSMLPGC